MIGRLGGIVAGLLAAVVLAAAALAAVPQNEGIEAPRCHGRQATIVGSEAADVLRGTPERDVIWGGGGDDAIYGSLGNDLICGGPGADLLHGGRGNDEVDGGAGAGDRAIGDLGDDKVLGGAGDYDEVAGDLGIDIAGGGPGDFDLVHGDYGYDRMSGGAGRGDVASFATKVAGRRGSGVWASLKAHRALGDGHDKLLRFESLEGSAFRDTLIGTLGANTIFGGAGDDLLRGAGGRDAIDGGQGADLCSGVPRSSGRTTSCGREPPPRGSAYVQLDPVAGGGAGLQVVGGAGADQLTVAYDEASSTFAVSARSALAAGFGCSDDGGDPKRVSCPAGGEGRWITVDGGAGDDSIRVAGSLLAAGDVRLAGGVGDDRLRGGPEDDLIEAGPGADRLYGGAGADGLVGGMPGPTFLYGGGDGDLLAAGGGCVGGALVGGPGRDDASFAEVGTHPGVLTVSFPAHKAWIPQVKACHPVHLSKTDEDMEGTFGPDVLLGNSRRNAILGQPGRDVFRGNGGDDVIDARDGVRDHSIQCGRSGRSGHASGRAITDAFDPQPSRCEITKHGTPVPGLNG